MIVAADDAPDHIQIAVTRRPLNDELHGVTSVETVFDAEQYSPRADILGRPGPDILRNPSNKKIAAYLKCHSVPGSCASP
jgi:hypothetical protein